MWSLAIIWKAKLPTSRWPTGVCLEMFESAQRGSSLPDIPCDIPSKASVRASKSWNPGKSGSSQGSVQTGSEWNSYFSSKLQLFAPCPRIKRKKAKKSAKKGEIPAKKAKKSAKKHRKRRFPPAPSTPTPLRTSQEKQALSHGHPARMSRTKLRSEKLRADFRSQV